MGDSSPQDRQIGSVELLQGDARRKLSAIEQGSVSLIVTSPPYNIGKEYERMSRRSLDQYKRWISPIARAAASKLRDGGHLCWQSGNYIDNGAIYPLDYIFFNIFHRYGLTLRNRIIWHFNFGLNASRRLSGRYETVLWFTKGDDYSFNLDPIRVLQRYPGKRYPKSHKSKAGQPSGNPNGKNPGDVWSFDPAEAFFSGRLWQFPNVKANHVEKTIHPCQFPIELAERCVLALTSPGELVLDPFVGTGTTAIAAAKHGRRAVGIDFEMKYLEIARQRYGLLTSGVLNERPIGRPVMWPDQNQRVAQLPEEWGDRPSGETGQAKGETKAFGS
jgi:DNA modification methylase